LFWVKSPSSKNSLVPQYFLLPSVSNIQLKLLVFGVEATNIQLKLLVFGVEARKFAFEVCCANARIVHVSK
jgi:hypothetical protein